MITEDSPLHKEIGRTVARLDLPNTKVILDRLCGGEQTIQLFCGPVASRGSRLCQVDTAVLLNNEVKAIVEIEESSHKPVQICGKVLVSAWRRISFTRAWFTRRPSGFSSFRLWALAAKA